AQGGEPRVDHAEQAVRGAAARHGARIEAYGLRHARLERRAGARQDEDLGSIEQLAQAGGLAHGGSSPPAARTGRGWPRPAYNRIPRPRSASHRREQRARRAPRAGPRRKPARSPRSGRYSRYERPPVPPRGGDPVKMACKLARALTTRLLQPR